uniref:4F5 domain-containing protein n=1 Tax=Heterorhabditis bacteriophora TaxID=37862 RepID=A0A1I7WT13_HETBA
MARRRSEDIERRKKSDRKQVIRDAGKKRGQRLCMKE